MWSCDHWSCDLGCCRCASSDAVIPGFSSSSLTSLAVTLSPLGGEGYPCDRTSVLLLLVALLKELCSHMGRGAPSVPSLPILFFVLASSSN